MFELLENDFFSKYGLKHFVTAITYIGFHHQGFNVYINTIDFDFDFEMLDNYTEFNFHDFELELDKLCYELRNR